jgi:hypothetical protein
MIKKVEVLEPQAVVTLLSSKITMVLIKRYQIKKELLLTSAQLVKEMMNRRHMKKMLKMEIKKWTITKVTILLRI